VLAYGKMSSQTLAQVSRFQLAVLNMYPSMGVPYMQNMVNTLRTAHSDIRLAQYVVLNELVGTAAANTDLYPAVTQVNAMNWWVRDAVTHNQVQWTNTYGTYEVNMTDWAPADSTGKRWPQWKANFDTTSLLKNISGLNYIFNDNVMFQPRYDADLMRIGTNQSRNDPTIMAHFRQGFQNYWAALRAANPTLKIMGNADSDLSYPEYKGQMEGAFNECLMGKSWSIETWGGWQQAMARYHGQVLNTKAPHDVVFQVCGVNGASPAQARYGFASTLMDDGLFMYTASGLSVPYWADEFDAPIGTPAEPYPTAATPSGIFMRKYTNGVTLVNPTTTTLSINIGPGYKHIKGTLDPVVNNGLAESTVTLPPKSGLIMIKG
jgi:hypothetical protein